MKLNWNFQSSGGGVIGQIPSMGGGIWIFSGTRHCLSHPPFYNPTPMGGGTPYMAWKGELTVPLLTRKKISVGLQGSFAFQQVYPVSSIGDPL